jgi:DNA-binding response OmpR family regulator
MRLEGLSMSARILLVDDDEKLSEMLRDYLGRQGYTVESQLDATTGLAAFRRSPPDALILDVMLPDGDGFELCRVVRSESDVPVLMLTARGEATDRIIGLELGADDYLPKPFDPRELLARLRAILRRGPLRDAGDSDRPLRFGKLEIDPAGRAVRVGDRACELTGYQFELLHALAANAGRVLSRERLMELVKGEPLGAFDRSIDVHISRIRSAIEDDPQNPRRVLTVRGAGYVLAARQDVDD